MATNGVDPGAGADGLIHLLSSAPGWVQYLASAIFGAISTVALALMRRNEALNDRIDKRVETLLDGYVEQHKHDLERIRHLEEENERLRKKEHIEHPTDHLSANGKAGPI